MPRDDSLPASTTERARAEAARPRAARIGLAAIGILLVGWIAYRQVAVVPGPGQMLLIGHGGEVTRILGPGQWGLLNPFSQSVRPYDMALLASDRSAPDRGMPALSAEGHALTLFGTAYWHEGNEDDLRWRYAHIRAGVDAMPALMAASIQTVMGRHPMEEIIRNASAIGRELTDDLKARARALIRVDVNEFALTRIDPGESWRAVVSEREGGRARAASIAASPAMSGDNPNALDMERIRRWDGRGIIPERPGRAEP
ncbi:SPFH domain-containing protein [Pararoseomonas indoligenes]|uniref:SPFH domain-containing protein n=1 Tax=Roseomonas indoligenes TaxID=2820811 RepID=A0A940MU11_9PROT|nr:SPFH domain-containing protein [Pararoseomonas indoligenes]MBP0493414.1 SPFH domain-containing protein [Pararoseomonas indoligenes]